MAQPQVAPGVYGHGRGQYSDSAEGMGMPTGFTGQPSAQNMAAAQALSDSGARGFNPAAPAAMAAVGGNVAAPSVANSTNSWAARNALRNAQVSANSITNDGGRFDSRRGTSTGGRGDNQPLPPSQAQAAYGAMVASDLALQGKQPEMQALALRENAATGRANAQGQNELTRTAMAQQGENVRSSARNALDSRRIQNEEGRSALDAEAKGFDIRQAKRVEALQSELEAANGDPAKMAAIERKARAINSKGASDWAVQVTPQTKNADGSTSEGSVIRYNKSTGQVERVDAGAGAKPMAQNPQALAIKNNTSMTREQKIAALSQLGY